MSVSITVGDAVRVPVQRCRSCEAPVFWARTASFRMMPIDIEPTPNGNLVVVEVAPVAVAAYEPDKPEHAGKRRFQSHFASCPNSAQHRKGRRP